MFITGSAPHLLGRHLAPVLRGRSLSYELLPLSFAEALAFRGIQFQPYSGKSEASATNVLMDYLRWGGFPEILLAEEPLRRKIITEYADLLYYRDLVDLGLMQAFTAQPDRDLGRKLENLVFLKRHVLAGELYYHADGGEVDVVQRTDSGLVFTNVCWALESVETLRREVTGLTRAGTQYPAARLELVAHDFAGHTIPRPIKKSPAVQYLLA